METVGFAYGQRHRVELDCAAAFRARLLPLFPGWANRLGEAHTLPLDALGALSDTALTRDAESLSATTTRPSGVTTICRASSPLA